MDDYSYTQQAVFTLEHRAYQVLKKLSFDDLCNLALLANPMLIEGWQISKKEDAIEEIINALGKQYDIFDISKVLKQSRLCSDILDAAYSSEI